MSFASPYWLQSWATTESPFNNMGLWEFCFQDFRHPDYQFDTLFNGCHWIWGEYYRLIREKLLPGKHSFFVVVQNILKSIQASLIRLAEHHTRHLISFSGWLIVVQFFATLALMASYLGQIIIVTLLLRWPLEIILRFEFWFCGLALVLNGCTGNRFVAIVV